MVGRAYNGTSNSTTLYMHSQQPGGGFGNATALQQALMQGAAQTREQQVCGEELKGSQQAARFVRMGGRADGVKVAGSTDEGAAGVGAREQGLEGDERAAGMCTF